MRLLFFILLVLLVAQIGFWNTLLAVLGAVAMVFLLAFLLIPLLIVGGILLIAASVR
jgi:hypothetical protein